VIMNRAKCQSQLVIVIKSLHVIVLCGKSLSILTVLLCGHAVLCREVAQASHSGVYPSKFYMNVQ
jgi:hypothetical protein